MDVSRKESKLQAMIQIILSIALLIFSWWFVDSSVMTDLTTYVTSELDAMREIVVQLTAISTVSSTALTLLPGDIATPLAENLADISDYLLVVFAALWLQKYLFSSMGIIVLKFLIPAGMTVLVFANLLDLFNVNPFLAEKIKFIGRRIAFFGAVIFLVVPTTLLITNQIEDTYQSTINQTIEQANQVQTEISDEVSDAEETSGETESPDNLLGQLSEFVTGSVDSVVDFTTGALEQVTAVVSDLPDKFMVTLNNLIDSVAVLIVVNCIAPLLVFSFLIWLVNLTFQLESNTKMFRNQRFRPIGTAVRRRTFKKVK